MNALHRHIPVGIQMGLRHTGLLDLISEIIPQLSGIKVFRRFIHIPVGSALDHFPGIGIIVIQCILPHIASHGFLFKARIRIDLLPKLIDVLNGIASDIDLRFRILTDQHQLVIQFHPIIPVCTIPIL